MPRLDPASPRRIADGVLLLEITAERLEIPRIADVGKGADERDREHEQQSPRPRKEPASKPLERFAVGDQGDQHERQDPGELEPRSVAGPAEGRPPGCKPDRQRGDDCDQDGNCSALFGQL